MKIFFFDLKNVITCGISKIPDTPNFFHLNYALEFTWQALHRFTGLKMTFFFQTRVVDNEATICEKKE